VKVALLPGLSPAEIEEVGEVLGADKENPPPRCGPRD
jgi:hypothetical protein